MECQVPILRYLGFTLRFFHNLSAGPTGPTGPTGPAGIQYQGAYNAATTYAAGDAVTSGGSSWYSLQAGNLNNPPGSSPSYWALLAQVGATGPAGPTGATGPQGATGPAGAGGITSVTQVTSSTRIAYPSPANPTPDTYYTTASCGGGTHLTGGGCAPTGAGAADLYNTGFFYGGYPTPSSGTPTGWQCVYWDPSLTPDFDYIAQAICAQ